MIKSVCTLVITFACVFVVAANAQDSIADRSGLFRSLSSRADENGVVDSHAVSTPNDPDLGDQSVLPARASYQPFLAIAAVPFYFTSNAALTHHAASSDFVVAPNVGISYQPE